MPKTTCSPLLAPTSPPGQGATTAGLLALRPLPYGGEQHSGARSDHPNTTHHLAPRGEHGGEHNPLDGRP